MKILDILSESLRTERIGQHRDANVLRDLYNERKDVKDRLNLLRISGTEDDEIARLVQQLADINANIQHLEGGVTESAESVEDAIKRGEPKLKEMERDLQSMKSAARTEEEHDAVEEFQKKVETQRRVLDRLRQSLKLHNAAKKSGVMESERGTDFGRSVKKTKRGYNKILSHVHKLAPTANYSKGKIGNSPIEQTPAEYLLKRKLKANKDVKKALKKEGDE